MQLRSAWTHPWCTYWVSSLHSLSSLLNLLSDTCTLSKQVSVALTVWLKPFSLQFCVSFELAPKGQMDSQRPRFYISEHLDLIKRITSLLSACIFLIMPHNGGSFSGFFNALMHWYIHTIISSIGILVFKWWSFAILGYSGICLDSRLCPWNILSCLDMQCKFFFLRWYHAQIYVSLSEGIFKANLTWFNHQFVYAKITSIVSCITVIMDYINGSVFIKRVWYITLGEALKKPSTVSVIFPGMGPCSESAYSAPLLAAGVSYISQVSQTHSLWS